MSVRGVAKQRARRAVDRVMLPYIDLLRSEQHDDRPRHDPDDAASASGASASGASDGAHEKEQPKGATSDYFHMASHELRTLELERVPKGARRALSVGAQGRWYFDWFERAVGVVDEHIGIEAFEPKPDDLPPYVTWIPDTADHMVGVSTGSVDLVFAGQTSEHLWAHELTGFLIEAHRVLGPDGVLALDSPNRIVTEHLHWSHGGHTIELSAGEMRHLLDLAGFDVLSTTGVWRCVIDGRRYELEEQLGDPVVFTRRAASGREAADECFVWWINARRTSRTPDRDALAAAIDQLFEQHWNTRVCRGLFPTPGADRLPVAVGSSGLLGETLPFPLHGGEWSVTLDLASGSLASLVDFEIRIVAPGDHLVHRLLLADASIDGTRATWRFEQPWLLFALVIQLHVGGVAADVEIRLPLDVRAHR